jgi:hypothetical protein
MSVRKQKDVVSLKLLLLVVVATLVGLGKKVQHAIDVTRKARPGTIRNPVQVIYTILNLPHDNFHIQREHFPNFVCFWIEITNCVL